MQQYHFYLKLRVWVVYWWPGPTTVQHVRGITSGCFYQLRKIHAVRKSLNVESAKLRVHAFVHSRLDYCNSVLQGVGAVYLNKIQLIQNGVARPIWSDHVFDSRWYWLPVRYWLPVIQRIHFKKYMLIYRSSTACLQLTLQRCMWKVSILNATSCDLLFVENLWYH